MPNVEPAGFRIWKLRRRVLDTVDSIWGVMLQIGFSEEHYEE